MAAEGGRFQLRLSLSGIYRGPNLRVKNGVIRVVALQRWRISLLSFLIEQTELTL